MKKVFINNDEIEINIIGIPEMNYGQLNKWKDHEKCKYTFLVSKEEFISNIGELFETFRKDEMEDPDFDDFQELKLFHDLNYPSLLVLFSNHFDLLRKLMKYMQYDIISSIIIPADSNSNVHYSINSLDHFNINNDSIEISGIAFKVEK